MSEYATGNAPGFQTQLEAQESEVLWSGRQGQDQVVTKRITLTSSAVDSGNTPTTTLRGGNRDQFRTPGRQPEQPASEAKFE